MNEIRITLPLTKESAAALRAGDTVLLTGELYTGRDAAHKRMLNCLDEGKPLPFDPAGQLIYYVGPAPASPGKPIGSAGPTSSYRMDPYTPPLLAKGLLGMMGKGRRSEAVVEAMKRCGAVYFAAAGGAAALLARRIKSAEIIAYEDLGPEAVRKLRVEDFPAVVVIDSRGDNLYESGPAAYAKTHDAD